MIPKKASQTKIIKIVKTATQKIIDLLSLPDASFTISLDKDNILHIDFTLANPGILIGFRGETLSSLQIILSLIVYKQLGYWQRLIVNVGDYREKREETLKQLALNAAAKVKNFGSEEIISYLNGAERRIIHLVLKEDPDVETESFGEGAQRQLTIRLKTKPASKTGKAI